MMMKKKKKKKKVAVAGGAVRMRNRHAIPVNAARAKVAHFQVFVAKKKLLEHVVGYAHLVAAGAVHGLLHYHLELAAKHAVVAVSDLCETDYFHVVVVAVAEKEYFGSEEQSAAAIDLLECAYHYLVVADYVMMLLKVQQM